MFFIPSLKMMRSNIGGILLSGIIVIFSLLLSNYEKFHDATHLSTTALAILIGILFSPIFFKYREVFQCGISFSSKKLLRLAIVLYGFNVSLSELAHVGFWGFVIASLLIVCVFLIACFAGVKFFGLDRETSMLIGAGSAICGAAAVLALESSLKSDASKGIIAVGMVVLFGLIGMFFYPLAYAWGMIPYLTSDGMGIYMGVTLHEVANVVGATEMAKDISQGVFTQSAANLAIIIKMMRVVMLVPFLFLVSFFLAKERAISQNDAKREIQIPWFAFMFLITIVLNTLLMEKSSVEIVGGFTIAILIEWAQFLCVLCMAFAMASLGLQINIKKFIQSSRKAFGLAFLLCIVLTLGGYFLTLVFKGVLW